MPSETDKFSLQTFEMTQKQMEVCLDKTLAFLLHALATGLSAKHGVTGYNTGIAIMVLFCFHARELTVPANRRCTSSPSTTERSKSTLLSRPPTCPAKKSATHGGPSISWWPGRQAHLPRVKFHPLLRLTTQEPCHLKQRRRYPFLTPPLPHATR